MNRCMVLAAFLFDPFRTRPAPPGVREVDGCTVLDEVMQVTPGMRERLDRAFPAAWRPERGALR